MMTENEFNFLRLITFCWLFFWSSLAAKDLVFKNYYSIYIVIIFHFFFTGIPLLLDIVIGTPDYDFFYRLHNLRIVSKDEITFGIYCMYVAVAPLVWWYTGRPKKVKNSLGSLINNRLISKTLVSLNVNYKLNKRLNVIKLFLTILCYLLLFMPTILWFFSPNPSLYLTYGAAKSFQALSTVESSYHRLVFLYCYISLLGAMGLIILQKKKNLSFLNFAFWLSVLTPMIISMWMHGKRNIIAYGIFVIFISLLIKGSIKGQKLLILLTVVFLSFGWFSYYYQTSLVRNIAPGQIYEISRLDYGSDHLIKLSIYSELNPDKIKILDHKFQTFYFNIVQYIPRAIWPNKPAISTYGPLLSAATFEIPVQDVRGGIKGCWLAESLSNIGWMAILLGPLMMSLFCRIGDQTNNKFVTLFTSLIALRLTIGYLNLVNTTLLIIWAIFVFRCRYIEKRKISSLRRLN
jgi:hypothetical protein